MSMMMAKSRLSGGYFGNALDTAGESEGSGSSGRIDTEITVSEDSSIPARKCISLNSSRHDVFGAPMQVVPLSNMPLSHRKDLGQRLRSELEQIRLLQKKIEQQRTTAVVLSSSSDILSCSNGNNGHRVERDKKPAMSSSAPRNKAKPGNKNQKPRGWNRGSSGKFESAVQSASPSTANAMLMKDCELLLKRLMNHQYAWVFNTPVDVVKLNLPDYFTIIKRPMDLGTVKNKLASGEYAGPLEFADDVKLTFSNAMDYNPSGNDVHLMADTLNKYFELRWKAIEKKLQKSDFLPLPANPDNSEGVKTKRQAPLSKKRKIASLPPQPEVMPPTKKVMSDQEKHDLGRELESQLGEMPMHIIDFLKEHSSNGRECGDDEIEIDIDDLSDDTLFTLRKLLDEFLQKKQKNKAKVEACEVEVLNDSGPSNSSLQPFKGNDPADEEVDIGGNEPPVSSYPHVEIEKDTTYGMNKSLSPGSSNGNVDFIFTKVYELIFIQWCSTVNPIPDVGMFNNQIAAFPISDGVLLNGGTMDAMAECMVDFFANHRIPPSAIDNIGYVVSHPILGIEYTDSDSSSDSEADDVKARPANAAKAPENLGSEAQLDEMTMAAASLERNQSVSGLDQLDDNSQHKPSSFDSDCQQDGDSAATERQFSPDKLYRAAVLKKRFLDTILKAREKTLTQGEKGDPEKLRQEREKLEMEQKKEKARLQAEAKAAEDARKQAEEEAAAEARRKRELEREAARQALLQMEKTVEINENSRILEDLELLRAVPTEQLPSSVDETSPAHSQDGLGSFKFGSSNPLEQLGLYIKADDEEEEGEPPCIPNPVNDVEEGEID
ncbi:Transcription factor GTE8 [Glycine soja]